MQPCTPADFARDPVGRYVAGPTYVHFCIHADLWGVILWGRPNEDDAMKLGRTLVLELAHPAVPHASIVDASRLEGGDVGAFALLERYLSRHSEALAKQVTRLALVRPRGLEGAIVAGAYDVLPRPYTVNVFGAIEHAIEWLGADRATLDALSEMHANATGTSPLLLSLRAWLEAHLVDPTIADAASALALSERSLQRKLKDHETTFQDEVGLARVRVAQRLLRDGDAALTTIAFEVGCASPQHFSALFRRVTGESPSTWRARHRH